MKLVGNVIEWCSWIDKSLTYGRCNNLSVDRFIYLFSDNCFGLSVEDSHDCYRTA